MDKELNEKSKEFISDIVKTQLEIDKSLAKCEAILSKSTKNSK